MENLSLVVLGLYTVSSVVDAGLQHMRVDSFSIHKEMSEYWDTIAMVVKAVFLFIGMIFLFSSTSPLGVSVFFSFAITIIVVSMFEIFSKAVPSVINPYINSFFYPELELNKAPNTTIQWGDSQEKLRRQNLLLIQMIVNVAGCFFSAFPVIFAFNALANLYGYIKNASIIEVQAKISSKINVPANPFAPTYFKGDEPGFFRDLFQPFFLQRNLESTYTLTCIPPLSQSTTEICVICQNESPDTQICQNGHLFHVACIVDAMRHQLPNIKKSITETHVEVYEDHGFGYQTRAPHRDYCEYTATVHKDSLLNCPLCRDPLPFASFTMQVDNSPVLISFS